MKTLKKLLSVVLALAMILGMTVTASAAFTDEADITDKEAVGVMNAVGVFVGSNGKMDPKGDLTRAQAAKLVAYLLLGQDVAEALPAVQVYSDVAASHWAAKYISYLSNEGVLAGVGGGKFDPNGKITGYAFGKMLLVALGYDAKIEAMTGTNWAINVAKLMESNSIAANVKTVASNAINREEAARYCLNTLKATMVDYDSKGTNISINGATIATGASKAKEVESTATYAYAFGDGTPGTKTSVQLGEKLYNGKLTITKGSDAFGRPAANTWKYDTKNVGTFVTSNAKLTYTTAVSPAKIFKDLGLDAVATASDIVDGVTGAVVTLNDTNTTDITGTGNGTLTEVFYESATKKYTITSIKTYFDTVTSVTKATGTTKEKITFVGGTFEIEGFAKDDKIAYTKAGTTIKSVEKLTAKSITPTSYVAGKSFVADGATYKYNATNTAAHIGDFKANDIYLDKYGYVLHAENSTVATNYLVVIAVDAVKTDWETTKTAQQAKVLKADGTVENVTITLLNNLALVAGTNEAKVNNIYKYTVKNGKVELSASLAAPTSAALTLEKGQASFTYGPTYIAGAKTLFMLKKNVGTPASPSYKYSVYTGVANVPSLTGTPTAGSVYIDTSAGTTVTVAYFEDATVKAATAKDVIFTSGFGSSTNVMLADGTSSSYFATQIVENGVINADAKLATATTLGVYTTKSVDSNGYITLGGPKGTSVTTMDSYDTKNGLIKINTVYYSVAEGCKVFKYSTAGVLTEIALADIKDGSTAGFFVLANQLDSTKPAVVSGIYIPE